MNPRLFIIEQGHSFLKACSVGLLIYSQPVLAEPVHVTFFGNNQYQPTGIEAVEREGVIVTVYNLDSQVNLEKHLAEGLPVDDLEKATAIARSRVAQISQQEMVSLFTGILRAREWGIERFPAIVFGRGESVVYGVTDLEQALMLWRDLQAAGIGQ